MKVRKYLEIAEREGASVAYGGKAHDAGGYFVEPTVLTGVRREGTVVRGDIFGLVLSALRFEAEAEAVRLANDTFFGIAAAVWTKECSPLPPDGGVDLGWIGVDKCLSRGRTRGSVRRLRPFRRRTGERARGGHRVHRDEVGLGGAHWQHQGPFPARVTNTSAPVPAAGSSQPGRA